MSQLFTLVIYTASQKAYADPIIDRIDIHRVLRRRYYREVDMVALRDTACACLDVALTIVASCTVVRA